MKINFVSTYYEDILILEPTPSMNVWWFIVFDDKEWCVYENKDYKTRPNLVGTYETLKEAYEVGSQLIK